MKSMGERVGVEIVPPAMWELMESTLQIPGVLGAGVPGAGGFDALFVLVTSPQARERVESLWLTWSSSQGIELVCPLLSQASVGGVQVE